MSDYLDARDQAVNDCIQQNSIDSIHRSSLETAFLNGCYGDDNANCIIPEGNEDEWAGVSIEGAQFVASHPDSPLPPRPPR